MTAIFGTLNKVLLATFLLLPLTGSARKQAPRPSTANTTVCLTSVHSWLTLATNARKPTTNLLHNTATITQNTIDRKAATIRTAITRRQETVALKCMSDLLRFRISAIPISVEFCQDRFYGWQFSLRGIINGRTH